MSTQPEARRAHCNVCGGEKNHLLIVEHRCKWEEKLDDGPVAFVHGEDHYELLQCAGCDRVTLKHTEWFSEYTDDEGRPVPEISYYPSAAFRRLPIWLSGMEGLQFIGKTEFVPRLLHQVYTALHNQSYGLAAMGIRALLERMIIDCVGDKGTFGDNLKAFEKAGYLGGKQREIVEATLEVGNASIHRNYNPSKNDVILTLDIAENVLQATYVNAMQADELKQRVPPRQKNP